MAKGPSGAGSSRGLAIYESADAPAARLFCCSYAGGSADAFDAWRSRLPADIELCAFQLPGRGGRFREPPLRSMNAVAEHILSLLKGWLNLPFVLYGHSMGAVAALEVARRLVDEGHAPKCLIVSGCAAPHLPSRRERPLHTLSRDELLKELVRLEGLPAVALERPDYIDTFLPTIRADMQCREEWLSPPGELPVPLHALGGTHDKLVPHEDLLPWKNYTSSTFVLRKFAGGHFFIKTAENEFLRYVSEVMAQYRRAPPCNA